MFMKTNLLMKYKITLDTKRKKKKERKEKIRNWYHLRV